MASAGQAGLPQRQARAIQEPRMRWGGEPEPEQKDQAARPLAEPAQPRVARAAAAARTGAQVSAGQEVKASVYSYGLPLLAVKKTIRYGSGNERADYIMLYLLGCIRWKIIEFMEKCYNITQKRAV